MVNGNAPQSGIILGAVLAGGRSSRMGVDKAHLSFQKHTLLHHQYERVASVLGNQNVVVSGNYPPYKHVVDQYHGVGPLGGIFSIVKKYRFTEYFLFVPIDMPKLSEKTILRLIQAAQAGPSFDCWSYFDFELPIVIKNSDRLEPILLDLLLQPPKARSIRNLIRLLNYKGIAVETDRREFLNANTANDWGEVINEYTYGLSRGPSSS